MQTTTTTRSLLLLSGLLLCATLTACGQKGPLTLPQPAPEVSEPEQQKNPNQQVEQSGEVSGSI